MFRLRKWYLDIVAARGDAFIGYSARLHWNGLRLGYASALLAPTAGEVSERHTFLPGPAPAPGAVLRWRCPRLALAGAWRPRVAPCRRTLLSEGAAGIEWECLAPLASARVRVPAGSVSGLGYAERLTLTLEPWRLPFHTLHWGRFLAPAVSLVWIVWEGDTSARIALRAGQPCALLEFAPCRLVVDGDAALQLTRERVLRSGPVVSPALRSVSRLASRLPTPFLSAREEKWLSRGMLEAPGAPPVAGWAIHEVVTLR